jgi:hypothetical protein
MIIGPLLKFHGTRDILRFLCDTNFDRYPTVVAGASQTGAGCAVVSAGSFVVLTVQREEQGYAGVCGCLSCGNGRSARKATKSPVARRLGQGPQRGAATSRRVPVGSVL